MDLIDLHLYLHLILAVQGRGSFITSEIKQEVENYLTEMVEINEHKIHAVSCLPDHSHVLISWNPNVSIDNLTIEIKQLSKHFILHRKWNESFDWQDGYAAFSCSESEVPDLIHYINNQPDYHKKKSFKEEFEALLQKNEIEYREEDLFEFYD